MTTFSRTASRLTARMSLGLVVLCFAALGAWTVECLWSQEPPRKKKRVEEEEDTPKAKTPQKKSRTEEEEDKPKSKPKSKVIPVEGDDENKTKSKTNRSQVPAGESDLKKLAEQAKHPGLRDLFRSVAVPHDLAVYPRSSVSNTQREDVIEPVPQELSSPGSYRGKVPDFTQLSLDWKRDKTFTPSLSSLETVRSYEQIAQDKVREFLRKGYDQLDPDDRNYLSGYDMLVASEQVLAAVLRWHESARQTRQRIGEEWGKVEASLRKQLLEDVLLKQMQYLSAARDWDKVIALTRRLAVTYGKSADRERIFRPVADMIQDALKDPKGSKEKKQEARKHLQELDADYPDNPAFRPLRELLMKEAQTFVDAAKALDREKSDPMKFQRIMELLHDAQETWPQLPDLRSYRLELSSEHPILRVGVRGSLPKYLSPAWACTDNEQRVVDMLFESLVKLLPDDAGGFQYRPGLAEYRPRVVPLGRQFELPRNALWSDKTTLNVTDIDFSLKMLQKEGVSVGRSPEWGKLLDMVESKRSPTQLTLRMKQGYLEPLALMTFKILPRDKAVNSEAFAKEPLCSGPFLLDASRHSDENRRECLIFLANPSYGVRPAKRELPHIREIRLYTYTDAVEELTHGKLDLILDLTAQEAATLQQKSDDLKIKLPTPSTAAPNRRIYFLAVNNRKFPDAGLRKALAYAINREALLNNHFRGPLNKQIHKPLNGPFPIGSWACNPAVQNAQNSKSPLDLFDEGQARNLSQADAVREAAKGGPWKLKYPQGDPALAEAMKALCDQVKALTGIVLEPKACDPYQLREDVEQTQVYDVAYYHYDFPDDTYWLAPLLGPSARARGVNGQDAREENIFCFSNKDLPTLLGAVTKYRDFSTVRKDVWDIHKWLNSEMPFIPLWQLDPLLAYNCAVKPSAFDSILVFSDIENWRLQRK